MDFLSDFLQNLLMALAPVLASFVAAWLVAQTRLAWQKAKNARPDVTDALEWAARTAVAAAEQAGSAKLIRDKKDYAICVADMWLTSKGITLDVEMISAAVEAAVWQEINKDKPAATNLQAFTAEINRDYEPAEGNLDDRLNMAAGR